MEDSFLSEMSRMKENSDKYEHQKKRYETAIDQIKEHLDKINDILGDLNPMIKHREMTSRGLTKDVCEYALKRLSMGLYVTLADLRSAFPGIPDASIKNVFYTKCQKINPKIQKRRVGEETQLYL